ncbi:MAG: hypothetical protein AAF570_06760 [Bacteroidota bacterium]
MKSFKALVAFALVAFVMVSCAKVEKILPKNDGLWNVTTLNVKTYVDGTLDSDTTYNNNGTMMFSEDGTGVITDAADSTSTFAWAANDDNDMVTITQDGLAVTYEVVESKKDAQEWMGSYEIDLGLFGVIRTDFDLKMERP